MSQEADARLLEAVKNRALQHPQEITALQNWVAGIEPKCIVEIGVANAGSLIYWAELQPDLLVGIDVNFSSFREHVESIIQRRLEAQGKRYFRFVAPSQSDVLNDEVRTVVTSYTAGIDFLFIDGDHTYHGARRDFETYYHLMNPEGGVIALHDIKSEAGCTRLWDELRTKYDSREFCFGEDDHSYGIGALIIGGN